MRDIYEVLNLVQIINCHPLCLTSKELVTRSKNIHFKKTSNSNQSSQIDVHVREAKFQMTPLMIASLRGSRDIVIHLISHGANVSMSDIKG